MVLKGFGITKADSRLDDCLKQLALTAQQHPPMSPERQLAVSQLVTQILASRHIGRPQRGRWSAQQYEELHQEALQKTCLYICQHIENYRPEHPVMAWFNNLLGFKFKEAVKEYLRRKEFVPNHGDERGWAIAPQENQDEIRQKLLKQLIKEDPEQQLQRLFVRGHPDVTFQRLAIARYIEDQTWATLAKQTGIAIPTLSSFFNRSLRKLKPYFHKHLQD